MTHVKRVALIRPAALTFLCAAVALGGMATSAHATSSISFTGMAEQSGTGFGNITNVLTVQKTTSEWGAVTWNGSADVLTGNAKGTSQTVTVSTLTSDGVTASDNGLSILFNLGQEGSNPQLHVHEFTATLYNTSGGVIDSATFTASDSTGLGLVPVNGNGTGQAGWVFAAIFDSTTWTSFFSNPDNRLGISVPQANPIDTTTNDGQENFFVGPATALTSVPEPAPLALTLSGLLPLGLVGLRRLRSRTVGA